MDEKDDPIAHHRILAGREIPMNYGRNNNSPATAPDGLRGEINRLFASRRIAMVSKERDPKE